MNTTRKSSTILMPEVSTEEPEFVIEEKKNADLLRQKMQGVIQDSKRTREKAMEPFTKKLYNFGEVSQLINRIEPNKHKSVQTVSDVLNLVNETHKSHGIKDDEVRKLLREKYNELPLDEVQLLQNIVSLDEDVKNMKLKNSYLEWWLSKIEKKRLQIAEHQAILALHKKRIFGNPKLKLKSPRI